MSDEDRPWLKPAQSRSRWKCPRCGSANAYQGTVLVDERDDWSNTWHQVQRTVTRCRQCDTMLGEKDKILSEEERKAKEEEGFWELVGGVGFFVIVGFIVWWIAF